MTNRNSKTYNIVLGGIITALSVVLMLLTILIPVADLVFAALAGILLICCVFEMGEKWSVVVYVAVSLLSFILLPEKSTAIYYIMFLGHYSISKSLIERINNKPLKITVKFVLFNICAVISALIVTFLFNASEVMNVTWYIIYAVLLNVTFFIYDKALDRIIIIYKLKWRKYIHKK